MSVEKYGIKGYEYQYLVSILVVLKDLREDAEIYIEKEEGEDARLIFNENNRDITLDIQIKKRVNQIQLDEFATWISHFQKGCSDLNLLSKMKNDENHYVLFVTDNRCCDQVSKFIKDNSLYSQLDIKFENKFIKDIKESIIKSVKKETNLHNKRKAFLEDFLNKINDNEFKEILSRYKIWEKHEDNYVYQKIENILTRLYYVPKSDVNNTINNLLDVIRYGRDKGESITSKIYETLRVHQGKRVFRLDFPTIERQEKKQYIDVLKGNNILLLTGVSFCGKTHMAKEIAQYFQDEGYEIKITHDLIGTEGAIQFLRNLVDDERLVILEDPFGHVEVKENYLEIKTNLNDLLTEIRVNRKVIITSRSDILLKVMRKDNLAKCNIQNNNWNDLTIKDDGLAFEIWKSYYESNELSLEIFNNIKQWIFEKEGKSFLQPGQIVQLWHEVNDIHRLKELSEVEILEFARADSKFLAEKFLNKDETFKKLAIALAIGANTINPISIQELSYILSNDNQFPGLNKSDNLGGGVSFSFRKTERVIYFPKYENDFLFEQDIVVGIKYFKEHGYITFDNYKKEILFTHPIYHHACKLVFYECINDIFVNDNIFMLPKHGIGALSKSINLNTINVLQYITIKGIDNDQSEEFVKQILLESIYSIYPAVVDSIIIWFSKRLNILTREEQQEFMKKTKLIIEIDSSDILWHCGEPWFNPNEEISYIDDLFEEKDLVSREEISAKISKNQEILPEEAWKMINSRNNIDIKEIDFKLLSRVMLLGESFIRKRAIYYLFKDYMFLYNSSIKIYLKENEHPSVVFSLFRGSLESWFSYSEKDRSIILKYLKNQMSVEIVAISIQKFIENFEDEHYNNDSMDWERYTESEKKELWEVWYELVIELFTKFPSKYTDVNQAHLYNVIMKSRKYISESNKIINISISWNKWLFEYKKYHLPNDYGMAVADYLIKATQHNSDDRQETVIEFLKAKNTSFLTTHLVAFIDNWDYMSQDERRYVCEILVSNREDVKWLKAVVLTRNKVPRDIQEAIFGEELFDKEIKYIVQRLEQETLLEYCLNVECGYPQPLWWNGYHHGNKELYNKIITYILEDVKNVGMKFYYIALREFLDSLLYDRQRNFTDGYNVLKSILKDTECRHLIFEMILSNTVTKKQCNKGLWKLYFESSIHEELEDSYDKICKNIESIEINQYSYDSFFDKEIIFNNIYPRLKTDYVLLKSWKSAVDFQKKGIEIDINKIIEFTNVLYESFPPRLNFTGKLILKMMEDLEVMEQRINENIENNRKNLIDIGFKQRKKYNDEYELSNWID